MHNYSNISECLKETYLEVKDHRLSTGVTLYPYVHYLQVFIMG